MAFFEAVGAVGVAVFDDIDVGSARHKASLVFAIPAVFEGFAAEYALTAHRVNVDLVIADTAFGLRGKYVVEAVAVGGEGIGDGKGRGGVGCCGRSGLGRGGGISMDLLLRC